MAYVRQEKETFEIDYPIEKVWEAIPEVLENLEWKLEQSDDESHHARIRTKAAFLAYSSVMVIDAIPVNGKTCRLTVQAETPVTTITAMADYGRTGARIQAFFAELAKQLSTSKNA